MCFIIHHQNRLASASGNTLNERSKRMSSGVSKSTCPPVFQSLFEESGTDRVETEAALDETPFIYVWRDAANGPEHAKFHDELQVQMS